MCGLEFILISKMVHIHFLGDKSGCVFGKGKIYVFGKLGKIYREECTHLAAGKEMYWLQRLPMAMVYRKEFYWKNNTQLARGKEMVVCNV